MLRRKLVRQRHGVVERPDLNQPTIVVQRTLDELRIRVGYETAKTADLAGLTRRVADAVDARTGVTPRLEMTPVGELLAKAINSKLPRVVKS